MADFVNCKDCGSVNDATNAQCRACGYTINPQFRILPNDPNVTRACEEEVAAAGDKGAGHG